MSLFRNIAGNSREYRILSASRMTDMPAWYPVELIEEVERRLKKGEKIHTLVLWTKTPSSFFKEPLYSYIKSLKRNDIQLYFHITITGMGGVSVGKCRNGSELKPEPIVPTYKRALDELDKLIVLSEKPERIRIRFDPIVNILDSNGDRYSNIGILEDIVKYSLSKGIRKYNFSLLEKGVYKKVDERLERLGVKIISIGEKGKININNYLQGLEKKYKVRFFPCAVKGFPETRCVDGEELSLLHDKNLPADLRMPKTRELCGCTKSVDLGGWPVKKCYNGCIYCYASPFIKQGI